VEPQPGVHAEDGRVHPGVGGEGHPDHGRRGAQVGQGRVGPQAARRGDPRHDGPFAEAKEVIGGFALINAADRAEAVEFAKKYVELFDLEIEVEVRQVVEFDDLPAQD
jgi:hypothetical protein